MEEESYSISLFVPISLSLISLMFIHVVEYVRISFLLQINNIPLYTYLTFSLSINWSVDTEGFFSHILAIVNIAVINLGVQICFQELFISLEYLPRREIAGLCGNSIFNYLIFSYSFPQQLTQVQSLGQDDPLEEGMVAHTSILAWRIWWTKEPGRLQSIGLQRIWYDWSKWACTYHFTIPSIVLQFSSVAQSCLTLCDLMDCSTPGFPVHHQLLEFAQTHVHQVGDAIQPSHPLSSPSPPAFNLSQHLGLFQWVNSSHKWPKYWSFSFSINPSIEYSGPISFRMDWLDLLVVQGTLKSLLQHHSSKASILRCSTFFIVQLSHPYMTTGKTIFLTQ